MTLYLLVNHLIRGVLAEIAVECLDMRDSGEIFGQDFDFHASAGRSVEPVAAFFSIFVSLDDRMVLEMAITARPVAFPGDGSLAVPLGFVAGIGNSVADFVFDFSLEIREEIIEVANVIGNQRIKGDAVKNQRVGIGVSLKPADDVHQSVAARVADLSVKVTDSHVTTAVRCQVDLNVLYISKFLHKLPPVIWA